TMAPQRGSQIAVTPRYERKRFEFALPVVLHEYRHPHIGAMIRLNSIIIGTDNLGAYLLNTELYGADLYVSIKYTIFRSFGCKQKKPRNRKSGKGVPPCWG
ncbi:MAG: hypothetical protein KDC12_08660, partial [Flavobacteriales bacterium]|nr:hypothetical protein [Flavobacteriales bacterium]